MDPPSPPPVFAPAVPTHHVPQHATLAMSLGLAAMLAVSVQFLLGIHQPIVVLAINLGFAAGAYGLLLLLDPRLGEAHSGGILQFVGFIAITLLGRVWLGQTAQGFAILFEYSLSLSAFAVATAAVLFRLLCTRLSSRNAALTNSVLGATAFAVLVIGLLTTSPTRQDPNLILLGLTCIIVPSLLGIQWLLARRSRWEAAKLWATPEALALAGTQLFDGILTYLAVRDPLGIAPAGYEEQIPLSRFILEWFGIGFPIAKWAIGLVVALILARARFRLTTHRVVLYLALLAAGMGPGLYTAAQLF